VPDLYRDGNVRLLPRWVKFMRVFGDCAEKYRYLFTYSAAFHIVMASRLTFIYMINILRIYIYVLAGCEQ
jgi:hypothetical protein